MRRMNIRTFRDSFSTVQEPVEVLKGVVTIGVFYPGGPERWLTTEELGRRIEERKDSWTEPRSTSPPGRE